MTSEATICKIDLSFIARGRSEFCATEVPHEGNNRRPEMPLILLNFDTSPMM